jgi:MFS transporter, DHA1 family, multidrug resistance protein
MLSRSIQRSILPHAGNHWFSTAGKTSGTSLRMTSLIRYQTLNVGRINSCISSRSNNTLPRFMPTPQLVSLRFMSTQGSGNKIDISDDAVTPSQSNVREPKKVRLFRMLHLVNFTDEEIAEAHKAVTILHAKYDDLALVENKKDQQTKASEIYRLSKELGLVTKSANDTQNMKVLNIEDFTVRVKEEGTKLDIRVWPIALSFLTTGLSIGVIIPILPILVSEIHLPNSMLGIAVAAFGLAKLIGNVPSAQWVERYGRKPVMIGGMVVCAAGLGCIGFSLIPELGAPWLIGCRFVTGLGVAAFTSGAFMYMSDISTSLNRTRTMAPVMSSFQAGTAVGPAIGGVAVQQLGIMNSYMTVGASIAVLAVLNQAFLNESKPPVAVKSSTPTALLEGEKENVTHAVQVNKKEDISKKSSFAVAFAEWKELMKDTRIRDIIVLNASYWVALSGTQLTLLPLFMVADPLSLNAEHLGIIFSSISIISVAAATPAAYMADKYGKIPSLLAGTGLLALSFAAIPMCTTFEQLLASVAPLALGSTFLSSVPTAHLSDLTTSEQRAQALALLRTAGDVGLLTGAVTSGILSEHIGMITTMQGNASLLAGAAIWFGAQKYLINKNEK